MTPCCVSCQAPASRHVGGEDFCDEHIQAARDRYWEERAAAFTRHARETRAANRADHLIPPDPRVKDDECNRNELRAGLELCAIHIAAAIVQFRSRHETDSWGDRDKPLAEAMVDPNGRPILAGMYADLSRCYAALADLGETA